MKRSDNWDKLYQASGYIVIGGLLLAYFIFQAMIFKMPLVEMFNDFKSWIHTLFTIFTQSVTVSVGYDKGLAVALESEEFKKADERNNIVIKYINNHQTETIDYIQMLNDSSRGIVVQDFLLSVGKLTLEDLTKKEQKELSKIKPVKHSSEGLNTPIYYAKTKGNTISYSATYSNESKTQAQTKKILFGGLFAFMTIAPQFIMGNIGNAVWSTIILSAGVLITYFLNFNEPIIKLTKVIPKRVDNKYAFYEGLKEWIESNRITNFYEEIEKKD